MAMESQGASAEDVAQCMQAEKVLFAQGARDCCLPEKRTDACVREAWPDFPAFGFSAECVDGALPFDDLSEELLKKIRPVVFTWRYANDELHSMVAVDIRPEGGGIKVFAIDPAEDPPMLRPLSLKGYDSSASHTHSYDFFRIQRDKNPQAVACPKTTATGGPEESSFPTRQEAAEKSLSRMVEAIQEAKDYKMWGFVDSKELSGVSLGAPIQVALIDGLKVKKLEIEGAPIDSAVTPVDEWAYPVLVEGEPRTLLRVSRYGDRWSLIAFGERPIVPPQGGKNVVELVALRDRLIALSPPNSQFFELQVPSIGRTLLGIKKKDKLYFSPVDREIVLRPGEVVPADALFGILPKEIPKRQNSPKQ